jgi:hypothetical protein
VAKFTNETGFRSLAQSEKIQNNIILLVKHVPVENRDDRDSKCHENNASNVDIFDLGDAFFGLFPSPSSFVF